MDKKFIGFLAKRLMKNYPAAFVLYGEYRQLQPDETAWASGIRFTAFAPEERENTSLSFGAARTASLNRKVQRR
jgi:hypothetical protein